jgi:hypothetical protein
MMTWMLVVSGCAVLWVLFVAAFHPFRKGSHAAPHGLTPDVHGLTMPVARTAGSPPWEAGEDPFAGYPEWARPEAPRWAVGGANSGAAGYSLDDAARLVEALPWPEDWPPQDGQEGEALDNLAVAPSADPSWPPIDPRLLAETWLDAQLGELFGWARDVRARLATL